MRQAQTPEATASDAHPHEPDVPPILDAEGRCIICAALAAFEAQRGRAGEELEFVEMTGVGPVDVVRGVLERLEWRFHERGGLATRTELAAAFREARISLEQFETGDEGEPEAA